MLRRARMLLPLFLAVVSTVLVQRDLVRSRVLLETMRDLPGEAIMTTQELPEASKEHANHVVADYEQL